MNFAKSSFLVNFFSLFSLFLLSLRILVTALAVCSHLTASLYNRVPPCDRHFLSFSLPLCLGTLRFNNFPLHYRLCSSWLRLSLALSPLFRYVQWFFLPLSPCGPPSLSLMSRFAPSNSHSPLGTHSLFLLVCLFSCSIGAEELVTVQQSKRVHRTPVNAKRKPIIEWLLWLTTLLCFGACSALSLSLSLFIIWLIPLQSIASVLRESILFYTWPIYQLAIISLIYRKVRDR